MKIKLITCEALVREFMFVAASSPHVFDMKVIQFGLHNTPNDLRDAIQREIDDSEGHGYDAVILGYGLCSRGTAELTARSVPLVVPRAHDCITLFLGSRERYSEEFGSHPGTYYYSPGWIERKEGEVTQGNMEDAQALAMQKRFEEYVEKYGEENAQFLVEQESQWSQNYSRAVFINMGLGNIEMYREFTRGLADDRGWEYSETAGDLSLFRRLALGDWDSEDFLRVEPGRSIMESFDPLILKAV